MARRGTSKRRSQDQERNVAALLGGKVSPSSGAHETDQGDVRCERTLLECKTTGYEGDEKRPSLNRILEWLEEITLQAWEEGREPALALRIYSKGHPLAATDGRLDLLITSLDAASTHSDW